MRDIFSSRKAYQEYLSRVSIDDLKGILRMIDRDMYPERVDLVEMEITRKEYLEEERRSKKPLSSSILKKWFF